MEPCQSTENLSSTFREDKKHLNNDSLNISCCTNADSGYSSVISISSHNISNISNSSIQTPINSYNGNLQAISEKKEQTDVFKLTPITQNVRSISNFHITTPKTGKGAKRLLAFDSLQTTPKKLKLDNNVTTNCGECILLNIIPEQTENIRPKKRKKFSQRFRSAPDLDTYFSEDEADNLLTDNKHIISPIRRKEYIYKTRAPLRNSNLNIIQSSTPKNTDTGIQLKSPEVRKLINFTHDQFDSLLNANTPSGTFELQKIGSTSNILNIDIHQKLLREYKLLYPQVHPILPDHEQNFEIQKKTIQECAAGKHVPPMKPKVDGKVNTGAQEALNINTLCNDMDISPLKSPCFCKNNTKNKEIVGNNYNIKCNSDMHLNLIIEDEHTHLISNKTRGKKERRVMEEIKTPTKKKPISIASERLEILYPFLPRTPSKYNNRSRYALSKMKKSITKNLCYESTCKKFYNGTSYLNIILKLEPFPSILEKILSPLSSQDLVNMSLVSKNWLRIVRANLKANKRIEEFLEQSNLMKENKDFFKNSGALSSKEDIKEMCINFSGTTKKPFGKNNLRIDRKRNSETDWLSPVSPSKRKFYENQKVVRTLSNNEILMKCPRCNKSSRIVDECNYQFYEFNNAVAEQQNAFAIYNNKKKKIGSCYKNFASFDMESKSKIVERNRCFPKSKSVDCGTLPSTKCRIHANSPLKADLMSSPTCFGECASIGCKYRFCLACFSVYHPGERCKLSSPTSPSKEDILNGILHLNSPFKSLGTRGKENLRRKSLKRLCFDN